MPLEFDVKDSTEVDNSVEPAPLAKNEIQALKIVTFGQQLLKKNFLTTVKAAAVKRRLR